jgi:hypothetical protein
MKHHNTVLHQLLNFLTQSQRIQTAVDRHTAIIEMITK